MHICECSVFNIQLCGRKSLLDYLITYFQIVLSIFKCMRNSFILYLGAFFRARCNMEMELGNDSNISFNYQISKISGQNFMM